MLNYSEDIYKPSERRKRQYQQNKHGKIIFLSILGAMVAINVIVLSVILSQAKAQSALSNTNVTLWENDNYESLAKSAERALVESPDNYEYQIIYGYSLYRLIMDGVSIDINVPKAISVLQQAANSPEAEGDRALFTLLGKLYYMAGNSYEAAIIWLNKSLEIKRDPETLLLAALSYQAIGNFPDAIQSIDQYRSLTGNPMAELLKGKMALSQGDTDTAQAAFSLVSNTAQQEEIEYLAMLLMAEYHIEQGKYGEAQRLLDTEIVGNKELAHEYYLRGVILEAQDKPMEARAMWRKALKMDPAHGLSIGKLSDVS